MARESARRAWNRGPIGGDGGDRNPWKIGYRRHLGFYACGGGGGLVRLANVCLVYLSPFFVRVSDSENLSLSPSLSLWAKSLYTTDGI